MQGQSNSLIWVLNNDQTGCVSIWLEVDKQETLQLLIYKETQSCRQNDGAFICEVLESNSKLQLSNRRCVYVHIEKLFLFMLKHVIVFWSKQVSVWKGGMSVR